jgi:cytidine deaminase
MSDPVTRPAPLDYPELVVGLAGPIGVDLGLIESCVTAALLDMEYESTPIKLTVEMDRFDITDEGGQKEVQRYSGEDAFNSYMGKMSYANALRKQHKDAAFLARIAIQTIQTRRAEKAGDLRRVQSKHAFLIRQLKRPEEVDLFRQVYGRQFVLVSAYASPILRKEQLCERLRDELSTAITAIDLGYRADQLMERDANEATEALGQQLRDTFHLGDVFVHGLHKQEIDAKVRRFVAALFGRNDITPSKDEYGMYAAKSASLRSADLSRQVGAAIFSIDGEVVTQGCNEVPKALGGTYWDLEEPDNRDIRKGFDPNERHKKEILRDLVERLRLHGLLSDSALALGNDIRVADRLTEKKKWPEKNGALVGSRVLDLTEYGRVVHAEMSALCDAARLGRSVKGATLYCTTFPCHNCTKHLLASGIKRVVYLEPYPKSRAKDLHPDEIEIEAESPDKLSFVPFMGISPYRYRDLFGKERRKDVRGKAQEWYYEQPRPMIDIAFASYTENEDWALGPLVGVPKPIDEPSAGQAP